MNYNVLFTVLSLISIAHLVNGAELRDILQNSSQAPKFITSYEFVGTYGGQSINNQDLTVPQKTKFSQSGSMFIVDSETVAASNEPVDEMLQHTIYAFNGSKYQWFIVGRDSLSYSDTCQHPNLYYFSNPLIMPYLWLVTQLSNWTDIHDDHVWSEKFSSAQLGESKEILGHECDVVTFPGQTSDDKIVVYFAKDLGFFPIRTKFINKKSNEITTIEVEKYKKMSIDMGEVVFPTEVTLKIIEKGAEDAMIKWVIEDESIRINPTLDDEMFTISPSRAGNVINYDEVLKKLGAASKSESLELVSESKNSHKIMIITLINAVFIIAILITFILKFRSK